MNQEVIDLLIEIFDKQNKNMEKAKQVATSQIETSIKNNSKIIECLENIQNIKVEKDVAKKLFNILINNG